MKRVPETCPGDCSLRCPVCARRFWQWAESHARGRGTSEGKSAKASFYDAAARWSRENSPA